MTGLVVDNFAGAGGASTGLAWAIGRDPDYAINHDAAALEMHRANHPDTHHVCEDVFDVDPIELCAGRPVDIAWFSPDCKFFSRAKGGKPVDNKIRGLAWLVIDWARAVQPRMIFLENVPEFENWGPLNTDGRPDKQRKGITFQRWVRRLKKAGYTVEWRSLQACDFGVPTTRKRLFLVARRDGEPIRWPEVSHGPGRTPFRTAAECIDFGVECPSIFERKKPLVPNTLMRIANGIRRYVIDAQVPFIVRTGHYSNKTGAGATFRGQPPTRPLSTVTSINDFALVMPRITYDRGKVSAAFLTKYYGTRSVGSDLRSPMPTATTKDRFGLVKALLEEYEDGVEPVVRYRSKRYRIADIGLRMLSARELANAQGFPSDFVLLGTKGNQVAKIGNSVPPLMAKILVEANLEKAA